MRSGPTVVLPLLLLVLVLVGRPTTAAAAGVLCSADVVALGDSAATVRERCGAPVVQRSDCVAAPASDPPAGTSGAPMDAPCAAVEQWNYRSASGRPSTVLKFESGRLKSIDDDRSTTSPNDR